MSLVKVRSEDFHRDIQILIEDHSNDKDKSTLALGRHMLKGAFRRAPRGQGTIIKYLTLQKINNGHRVESVVPGTFKHNLFANNTSPFRVLRFKKPNKYFKSPQTVIYGESAVSPSGKVINWSAQPGFFTNSVNDTIKRAKKIIISVIK